MIKLSIGFSHKKGSLLSKLIMWIQGTHFSHVYIRRDSKYGEYVYQASGLQVNFSNIESFLEESEVVEEFEFDLEDESQERLLRFFIKYAGRKYSISSLFKILAIFLADKFKIKLKLHGDGSETFICSELGALFLEEILQLKINEEKDFITPKELYRIISQNQK